MATSLALSTGIPRFHSRRQHLKVSPLFDSAPRTLTNRITQAILTRQNLFKGCIRRSGVYGYERGGEKGREGRRARDWDWVWVRGRARTGAGNEREEVEGRDGGDEASAETRCTLTHITSPSRRVWASSARLDGAGGDGPPPSASLVPLHWTRRETSMRAGNGREGEREDEGDGDERSAGDAHSANSSPRSTRLDSTWRGGEKGDDEGNNVKTAFLPQGALI
ncbi:hypothetical protein B0H16DRAFT_1704581 [Mycena metata]|uniref:Uncharacterized protein n=1 Tax=Mycena metata TaxID=1033252 RepID=A0AAD7GUM5_9AGAR|nr:hypothetical protein B0H16DRAFT_1704581 [Mycena metata]